MQVIITANEAKLALLSPVALDRLVRSYERESRDALAKIKLPFGTPIFAASFINGVHTVFNRQTYEHGPAVRTRKEALRIADDLNAGKIRWVR